MNSQEYVDSLVQRGKAAALQIEHYTQEQADAMCRAVGKACVDSSESLGTTAFEETHMGDLQSCIARHAVIGNFWHYMKGKKSVGVLDHDPISNITTLAKPMGVVAGIVPSTNPTNSPAYYIMIALKGRNSIVLSPHPGAKRCANLVVDIARAELNKLGAPADLVQCIEEPTIEMSGMLMAAADVTIATGGIGMVKAAYSSGKPCFGVGQGNVQCIVDEDYADLELLTNMVISNRTAGNGSACTGEQIIYLPRKRADEILKAFEAKGAFILRDEERVDILRREIFPDGVNISRAIVGKRPAVATKLMGIDIPEQTRLLMFELHDYGKSEILCREIMFPVLRYFIYDDFKDACRIARENLLVEGAGHSSTIYAKDEEKIVYAGDMLPVGRLLVEQPGGFSAGSTFSNGLAPTVSVGCGSWGNNSISVNLTFEHLLNITKVSRIISDAKTPTPEEIWGI